MRGYPEFSFWISITLIKIYISCIIINRGKNTFELVGTVLNESARTERLDFEVNKNTFSFPELQSSWPAPRIDPWRWPRGSQLWEREWWKYRIMSLYLLPFILSVLHLFLHLWSTRSLWKMQTTDLYIILWWSSALMKREVLLVDSHDTGPENGTVAVIGLIRDRNVVPMSAAVPFVGVLRDISKEGCEED